MRMWDDAARMDMGVVTSELRRWRSSAEVEEVPVETSVSIKSAREVQMMRRALLAASEVRDKLYWRKWRAEGSGRARGMGGGICPTHPAGTGL